MNLRYYQNRNKGISELKSISRLDSWTSSHVNCFRGSFGKAETEKHLNKKYDRWKHYRKQGFDVFVELRLKNGLRPDLTVVKANGEIFHEEIIFSEKKTSMDRKVNDYPYPVYFVDCGVLGCIQ